MGKLKVATTLLQSVAKYTKTGCRLVSKERQCLSVQDILDSRRFQYSWFAGCKDIVKVETAFGKGSKTITSYFDFFDENKLVGRVIQEYQGGKEVSKIVKKFSRTKAYESNRTYNIFSTESAIYKNGVKSREIEDKFVLGSFCGSPQTTHLKFDVKEIKGAKRLEAQLYEELIAGSGRTKYLETSAKRLGDGRVVNKTLSGNLANMDEIAKDPYLYIRNYKPEDFAYSARHIAERAQKTLSDKGDYIVAPIERGSLGVNYGTKKIIVDVRKHSNNTEIIDTINHEFRHRYQHIQMDKLEKTFFNIFRASAQRVEMSIKEKMFGLRTWLGNLFYCQPETSQKLYRMNFMERDARRAGSKATRAYETYSYNLAQNFSAPSEIFRFADDSARLDYLAELARLG